MDEQMTGTIRIYAFIHLSVRMPKATLEASI